MSCRILAGESHLRRVSWGMSSRMCRECGETVLEKLVKTRLGRRNLCRVCHNVEQKKWRPENPLSVKRTWKKHHARLSHERRTRKNIEKFIYEDSRRSDKKKGFTNNLTKEFIKEQIAKGCSYCGETELRMTLDRIDNDLGHTKKNVVPACIRCNYARRSMPYEAWLCLKPGLRRARKQGLFGDWTGKCR